ncbi:hypothetical protein [Nguyenibacter sp. L1]|uniref:hypothetical protein n=1 Tax=Nguyenibacter sp. L1 TaxID=3049350 RepID=UPI002B459D98|nr:hypothetical protein [Nguyenibacter sp. L1]WRH88554.1 hypothetical protein QN315_02685 [Nguyenibacter sp. L1]
MMISELNMNDIDFISGGRPSISAVGGALGFASNVLSLGQFAYENFGSIEHAASTALSYYDMWSDSFDF